MDSRVAQVQQQLRDRNAEINELCRELRVRMYKPTVIYGVWLCIFYVCDQTAFREESEAAVQRPPVKLRVSNLLRYEALNIYVGQ